MRTAHAHTVRAIISSINLSMWYFRRSYMKEEDFKVKPYGKSELAMMYFPESDPHVALNRLNNWIRRCPPLVAALAGCYQSTRAKYFSPKAVRLIVEYLGEP